MATLSKHGATLLVIERLSSKLAYMSDGNILINQGDGWKCWRKVKPGVDPVTHAREREERYKQFLVERPGYAEYRRVLHAIACNGKRSLVRMAVEMLGNDVDGLWSELNDHADVSVTVDDCVELSRAYDWSQREAKEILEAKAVAQSEGGAS